VSEIREAVKYYGFKAGDSELVGAERSFMYRGKPLALLPFARPILSADRFWFDPRNYSDGKSAICDREVGEIPFPYRRFAEFLPIQALAITEDLEYLIGDKCPEEIDEQRCEFCGQGNNIDSVKYFFALNPGLTAIFVRRSIKIHGKAFQTRGFGMLISRPIKTCAIEKTIIGSNQHEFNRFSTF